MSMQLCKFKQLQLPTYLNTAVVSEINFNDDLQIFDLVFADNA